jgi:hypothetical protein
VRPRYPSHCPNLARRSLSSGNRARLPDLTTAEHLNVLIRIGRRRGRRREGLGLERPGGDAHTVPHRVGRAVEVLRPQVAPEPDLRQALVEGGEHHPADSCVTVIQIRPDRDGRQARTPDRHGQRGLQVANTDPENLQRPGIAVIRGDDRDVPAGHHPVEQPAPRGPHHLDHAGCERRQPGPQGVRDGGTSELVCSANTSVSRIDGSSNHDVSISLRKATISVALT